jgi:hypothetical protein
MHKQVFEALLSSMLESAEGISDLLFTVGRPPLTEAHVQLEEFPIDTPNAVLCTADIAAMGPHVINGSDRRDCRQNSFDERAHRGSL